jgi:hypothetical protein
MHFGRKYKGQSKNTMQRAAKAASDAAALEEQLKLGRGISGPRVGL